jgi:hypothetical protein
MKKSTFLCASATVLASLSGTSVAQDSDYHSALSDNYVFTVGAFRSDNAVKIGAAGVEVDSDEIDFGKSVGVDQTSTIANVQLRWKFGRQRKWSIWGQYFSSDASGDATLKEDVDWQDVTFQEGTFVEAGVELQVARLFMGRSFVKNEQHDFGVGVGIHNLDISSFIGGEIIVDEETTGYKKVDVGGSQILPNVGAWYMYSPASRWLIHGRLDWISANIGKFDGTLWNTNVGVNFQAWRHVGIDLSYQYFDLDVAVDNSDWRGGLNMTYNGPVISMTANW